MAITSNDVVRARVGDRFLDKTGMGWEILDKWSEVGGAFCFELYFPNYRPIRVSYNEGMFRIVGETPFALDDLNHPAAKFEKENLGAGFNQIGIFCPDLVSGHFFFRGILDAGWLNFWTSDVQADIECPMIRRGFFDIIKEDENLFQ